jgi:hypothetical protein
MAQMLLTGSSVGNFGAAAAAGKYKKPGEVLQKELTS